MKKIMTILLVLGFAAPALAGQKVVVEGSTTLLPIAQKAAEEFMKTEKDADISIRGGGSGVGIASLIDGACDIGDSSRPIKQGELDRAAKRGRKIKAHIVAMDGLSSIVHPSNTVGGLTKEQLKKIYTTRAANWKEFGGPDLKIVVVSRDSAGGTFEAFGELVLNKKNVRPDAIMQASNQGVVSIVARTPGAIGYVGLGYLSASVKAISVNGVMPSRETVLRGKYPVSRPLFMYTAGEPEGMVKKFIEFVKGPEGQKLVEEEGFVSLKK
ncbi:MAG: phosphate ABC transporter substrate-binding protein [Elusimicrobia bacterium]|nr:phosphate ABC transporter substrate-binding protein [Elusimicrobiota bacterium]